MDPVALWLLCGLASSTAFTISQRRFIRDNTSGIDDLVFFGLFLAIIIMCGPVILAALFVGGAAKALARLIP